MLHSCIHIIINSVLSTKNIDKPILHYNVDKYTDNTSMIAHQRYEVSVYVIGWNKNHAEQILYQSCSCIYNI